METSDPSLLDDDGLAALAAQLDHDEQHLSRRRTVLQSRIDFLRSGGYAALDDAQQLDTLLAQERALSQERHALHARIADVAAERGRRSAHAARRAQTEVSSPTSAEASSGS